jgi:hypothetical protein
MRELENFAAMGERKCVSDGDDDVAWVDAVGLAVGVGKAKLIYTQMIPPTTSVPSR